MISGVVVKHFLYCPAIVRITELGFEERVTDSMMEGEEVDKETVGNFLFGVLKAKELIRKPVYKYKDLVGSPDFVLGFSYYYSPLDVKYTNQVHMDHKAQVLFYAFIMEKLGFNVKQAILYYIPVKKLVKINYTNYEREYVERILRNIVKAKKGFLKVRQPVRKCANCGYFQFCKPKRVGNFYEREF
ncbi:CRISPR-associated protein Cas4 [Acidianus manzaensis]|uniref:CRISPR-associated exonuclease Cas4 n=1 Tax=Acidianus manzaensis TaxID=282676 RepID=A0A1W6JWI6_9CREN|nr:CRISPR-associated protein Cas4 [Acidianus manzaensis]ARM74584.1 CRISPR-associated protein Cas4 [Acidianus manzaensis]